MSKISDRLKISREISAWYFLAFFFVLAFVYFYFFGAYILFFQEQQYLFVFSSSYLHEFLSRPGGLLDLHPYSSGDHSSSFKQEAYSRGTIFKSTSAYSFMYITAYADTLLSFYDV